MRIYKGREAVRASGILATPQKKSR